MAGDFIGASVSGLEELHEVFEQLGATGTKAAIRAAARKSLKPVAADAARLAPVGTFGPLPEGHRKRLKDSIAIRSRLSRSQMRKRRGKADKDDVLLFVGSTARHAHLVEFGHVLVRAKRDPVTKKIVSKRPIGFVRPHSFMRVAWDMNKQKIHADFLERVEVEIARVVKRYARQAERGKLSKGAREMLRIDL